MHPSQAAHTIRHAEVGVVEKAATPYAVGFVVEQALGHVTHGKNLQKCVVQDPTIRAQWCLPSHEVADGLAGHVNNWTVKAGLQARRGIRQMLGKGPLDALLFHTQVPAVLCQDWMRRIPSVVSMDATPMQYDGFGDSYDHQTGSTSAEKIKFWLNRRCYQQASHLVTWSDWAKRSLINDYGIEADKVTTIYPGIDLSLWQPPAAHPRHERVRILFVGGNFTRKGGDLLLLAFQQLLAEGLPVELHLVTRDAVAPSPHVFVYSDMQPNSAPLRQLYQQCDLFCLPTMGDMLALSIVEAAATGLPVITTPIAGIPEVVIDNETGILVPVADARSLVQALRRLIDNPAQRQELGANAAKNAVDNHSCVDNSNRLLSIVKQLM